MKKHIIIIVGICACLHIAHALVSAQIMTVTLKGTVDRETLRVHLLDERLNETEFSLRSAAASPLGRTSSEAAELKNILMSNLEDMSPSPHAKSKPEVLSSNSRMRLVEIEIDVSTLRFTVYEVSPQGLRAFSTFLKNNPGNSCVQISEYCVKCSDKKIYCTPGHPIMNTMPNQREE